MKSVGNKSSRIPHLSIIIVNWNSKDVLENCLHSIYNTINTSFEIIVVDNASVDGSAEMVKGNFPEVNLVEMEKNLGFSKANNAGFIYTKAEYILLLNPDVILLEDSIDRMVKFLESHEEIGLLGPRIMEKNGKQSLACKRKLPTIWTDIKELFLLEKTSKKVKRLLTKVFPKIETKIYAYYSKTEECECLEGSCLLLRRVLFEKLKGFDEEIPMFLDDIDLCYRVRKMGLKNFYLADSSIIHIGKHSTKKTKNYKIFDVLVLQAHLAYFRKHYGLWEVILLKLFIGLSIPFLLVVDAVTLPFFIIKGEVRERAWVVEKHVKYFNLLTSGRIRCLE